MSEQQDIEARRARDLERWHRRAAERTALGLCPRCGKRPPEPERSQCGPCAEKRNRASRTRDARLRAAGIPRRDPDRANAYERERSRRERAAREAAGICTACGAAPAAPDRVRCEPCLEKRRASDRAKYAAGKAAGLPYGGSNIEAKRRSARARSKKRQKERIAAGLCIRCGAHPPAEGGSTCQSCRDRRQAAERQQYQERRAARLCTRCGGGGDRRSVALYPMRHRRGGQPRSGAQERALAQAVFRTARPGVVYILRSAFAGGVEMRPVRREILSRLVAFPGHPGVGPDLDGDRAGHGARARPVRQRGRRRPLPGLREARPRPGRDRHRREPDGRDHVLVLNPGSACRRADVALGRRKRQPVDSPALAASAAPIMTAVLPPRAPSRRAPGPSFHTAIKPHNGAEHGTPEPEKAA